MLVTPSRAATTCIVTAERPSLSAISVAFCTMRSSVSAGLGPRAGRSSGPQSAPMRRETSARRTSFRANRVSFLDGVHENKQADTVVFAYHVRKYAYAAHSTNRCAPVDRSRHARQRIMKGALVERLTGLAGVAIGVASFLLIPLYFTYAGPPPASNVLTRNLIGILLC